MCDTLPSLGRSNCHSLSIRVGGAARGRISRRPQLGDGLDRRPQVLLVGLWVSRPAWAGRGRPRAPAWRWQTGRLGVAQHTVAVWGTRLAVIGGASGWWRPQRAWRSWCRWPGRLLRVKRGTASSKACGARGPKAGPPSGAVAARRFKRHLDEHPAKVRRPLPSDFPGPARQRGGPWVSCTPQRRTRPPLRRLPSLTPRPRRS